MPWRTWHGTPDKELDFLGRRVLFWHDHLETSARCSNVEVTLYFSSVSRSWRGPVSGKLPDGFFGYYGESWPKEPSAQEFEAYVLRVLDALTSEGRLS